MLHSRHNIPLSALIQQGNDLLDEMESIKDGLLRGDPETPEKVTAGDFLELAQDLASDPGGVYALMMVISEGMKALLTEERLDKLREDVTRISDLYAERRR